MIMTISSGQCTIVQLPRDPAIVQLQYSASFLVNIKQKIFTVSHTHTWYNKTKTVFLTHKTENLICLSAKSAVTSILFQFNNAIIKLN